MISAHHTLCTALSVDIVNFEVDLPKVGGIGVVDDKSVLFLSEHIVELPKFRDCVEEDDDLRLALSLRNQFESLQNDLLLVLSFRVQVGHSLQPFVLLVGI